MAEPGIARRDGVEVETDTLVVERSPPARARDGVRAALLVFVVVELVAGVLYVWQARRLWFFQDDWDFFVSRSLGNVDDLLRPHNEHWTTIPIVVYRILYATIGLHSYVAYASLAIALHLTLAALIRVIARRAGVNAWIATAVAALFALFGTGSYDILWSFQIAFTGALVLGFTHLILADHDGPFDRRDLLGIAAGLAALMTSGLGVTMAVVAGIFVLLRRGWPLAVIHVLPLAVVYGAWWVGYGQGVQRRAALGEPRELADFVDIGLRATFDALGGFPVGGTLLLATLGGGLVAVFVDPGRQPRRAELSLALLAGAVLSYSVVAVGRDELCGAQCATKSRYVHVAAACLLPALALAVDALARHWRAIGVVVTVVMLLAIPEDVREMNRFVDRRSKTTSVTRSVVLTVPQSPLAAGAPSTWRPEMMHSTNLTVGWLRDAYAAGKLPHVEVPPAVAAANIVRLSFVQRKRPPPAVACRDLTDALALSVPAGGGFLLKNGGVDVRLRDPDGSTSRPVQYDPGRGRTLVSYRALDLLVSPASEAPSTICPFEPAHR